MNQGLDQYTMHTSECPTLQSGLLAQCTCGLLHNINVGHACRLVAEKFRDGLAEAMAGTSVGDPVTLSAELADDLLEQLNDALQGYWKRPAPVQAPADSVTMGEFFKGRTRGSRAWR